MDLKTEENTFAIVLEGVSKRFHSGDDIINAIDNCNLRINPGQFVCIMGPSGSGKSTLLNLISGLSNVTDGKVFIFGQGLHKISESDRAILRRKNIGIVFQFYNLHEGLTSLENIELPMLIAGIPQHQRRQRAEELLNLVDMSHRTENLPYELSGGEKQRIGIARALSNDPDIILADEPTGDLDHEIGDSIMELLIKLNKEKSKTIVMVTHDASLIRENFRLIRLNDGIVSLDEIVENLSVLENDISIKASNSE